MSITGTLIIQVIVFLILVGFTMKFVWPPIATALDERARKIAEGLAAADKAKSELAAADRRVEEELAKSRNETAALLADAERLVKFLREQRFIVLIAAEHIGAIIRFFRRKIHRRGSDGRAPSYAPAIGGCGR